MAVSYEGGSGIPKALILQKMAFACLPTSEPGLRCGLEKMTQMNVIIMGEGQTQAGFSHRMREFRASLVKNYTRKTETSPMGARQVSEVNLRV